jgi:hypothetical protein
MTYRLVSITKTEATPNGMSADPSTYQPGWGGNARSLPAGYWMTGFLLREPAVGEAVVLLRVLRNGIAQLGIYSSTPVLSVGPGTYSTANSVYKVETVAMETALSLIGQHVPTRQTLGN